jgi:hypothetical protein
MGNNLEYPSTGLSRGFIIRIINNTNGDVFIPLFVEHDLPDSISISTNDGQYDYKSLLNIAKEQSFEGSIIYTNYNGVLAIEIKNGIKVESLLLENRIDGNDFQINGFDKYITVQCPRNSNFQFILA